jgi:hypothetical protein
MKRLLMVCALAGLALACGDDDGDKPVVKVDGGTDGGIDGGPAVDGGAKDTGVATSVKVTNVGTACTTAAQCTGTAPECRTTDIGSVPIAGGSCSAPCSTDAECGPGGNCAVGVAIKMFGADRTKATLGDVGYCHKTCTALLGAGCPTGQSCFSLYELAKAKDPTMAVQIAPLTDLFCYALPIPARPDGGVGDAGTVTTLDGGLDAGH